MLDTTLLLTKRGNRRLAVLTTSRRVRSMWGSGQLRYLTDDGHVGVQLDGETRVDEYSAAHVEVIQ